MIALVLEVIRSRILSQSILKVSSSMSQNTTFAFMCSTTFAEDIHVNAGTIISSSSFKSKATSDICNADVHEVVAMEYLAPLKALHFSQTLLHMVLVQSNQILELLIELGNLCHQTQFSNWNI